MTREEFINVAEETLDSLPEEFRSRMQNVAIRRSSHDLRPVSTHRQVGKPSALFATAPGIAAILGCVCQSQPRRRFVLERLKDGTKLKLQGRPIAVLALLLERPGELVTREELRKSLWPEDTFVDFENSLNTHIKKLRQVFDEDAETPRYIETLPRRGYRFIAQVEVATNGNVVSAPEPAVPPKPHRWKYVIVLLVGVRKEVEESQTSPLSLFRGMASLGGTV